jgi:hypothetical protein
VCFCSVASLALAHLINTSFSGDADEEIASWAAKIAATSGRDTVSDVDPADPTCFVWENKFFVSYRVLRNMESWVLPDVSQSPGVQQLTAVQCVRLRFSVLKIINRLAGLHWQHWLLCPLLSFSPRCSHML